MSEYFGLLARLGRGYKNQLQSARFRLHKFAARVPYLQTINTKERYKNPLKGYAILVKYFIKSSNLSP